jgi:GT2 family glycosyltransferase
MVPETVRQTNSQIKELPSSMPLLSIIIVNYNSAALIIDCIRSIKEFNQHLAYEIIVVDNNSSNNDAEKIITQFPEAGLVKLNYNSGFARANNAGMSAANGDVYLLLNPDTISIDDSISRCYQNLVQSDFIAAGVQQLNADRTLQISGNFFVKGGLNHLLPIPYWGWFIRWLGYRTKSKVPNVQEAKPIEEVDWISGAFLMVKKEAVEKAGTMDEDFFLYAEEVEWCSRLKKIGRLCIFGELHIIHLEGATINEQHNIKEKGYYNLFDKKGLQLMVSNHLRVRKQYGVSWFLFLLLNYSWGVLVFWICSTVHRLFTLRNPFGDWKKVGRFAGNVLTLWRLSPKIISNKPHFYKMF